MIQHHKGLSLELLLPADGGSQQQEGLGSAAAPAAAPAATIARSRKARSHAEALDALEKGPRPGEAGGAAQLMRVNGHAALVALTATGLEWTRLRRGSVAAGAAAAAAPAAAAASEVVPFSEMLAVQCPQPRAPSPLAACLGPCLPCLRARAFSVQVLAIRRPSKRRCEWAPRRVVLQAADDEAAQDWLAALQRGVEFGAAERPRALLVLLNPNAGARRAGKLYRSVVAPLFATAGIRTTVQETQRRGHAADMVQQLSAADLKGLDGVVCVGGDGIFNEAINGLLAARAAATAAAPESPAATELLELLAGLRLAHIPAGSTDAVACTLHGSRDAFTAAAHIVLGDATPLDVLRVDTAAGGTTRFATCIAAYGFLADIVADSEAHRWLGPLRYDLVGAAKLLASRAYPARVRYLEGEVGRALRKQARTTCGVGCSVCRTASFLHSRRWSEQQMAAAASPSMHSRRSRSEQQVGGGAPSASCPSSAAASPSAKSRGGGGNGSIGGGASAFDTPALLRAASSASLDSSSVAAFGGTSSEPASPAVLRLSGAPSAAWSSAFLQPAAGAAERQGGEEWKEVEGEFVSVMLVCMPCRSDMTRSGMARYGHLADGRLKLILVHKCSPLQYLRFLLHMSRKGCAPGDLPYVTVLDAVAAQVQPLGRSSYSGGVGGGGMLPVVSEPAPGSARKQQQQGGGPLLQGMFSLDGELVRSPEGIAVEVHLGLLRVFSRGVEE